MRAAQLVHTAVENGRRWVIVAEMRWRCLPILFVCLAAWLGAAELRVSKLAVKKEVVAVVEAQLAAFRDGNVQKAYEYAAGTLRAQAPLRTFTSIVQNNYPEIWANARAEYGLVRDDGSRATLVVYVYTDNGAEAAFDYVLLKERTGWRIGSVVRHVQKPAGEV